MKDEWGEPRNESWSMASAWRMRLVRCLPTAVDGGWPFVIRHFSFRISQGGQKVLLKNAAERLR